MVSDAQGQRRNQAELMPSVIDFLHSQSDVEFLKKTLRIELTRIEEQGPNLVERRCDILNWTNAQYLYAPNVS
jgi:hypothetical protein